MAKWHGAAYGAVALGPIVHVYRHVYRHVHRHVHRHVCGLGPITRASMRTSMLVFVLGAAWPSKQAVHHMCIDMWIAMCMDMCIAMCWIDICIDMCMDMCIDSCNNR